MKRVKAFVLAGGRTRGLSALARQRSIAAVPFAGKYRLIDFTLSNCVNSELYDVAVLAQYAPLSLAQHLGRGEPWDLNRRDGGVQILQPYARQEGARWYEGTADALRQNLDVLENSRAERVFVLSGDLVYKMDYSWMLREHEQSGAAVTLAVGKVPYGETSRFGMVRVDKEGRIVEFQEKPETSSSDLAFMGVYLFNTSFLRDILLANDKPNLVMDILLPEIRRGTELRAYRFDGYWDDVGTIRHYYRAHQRLLGDKPAPDLYDPGWRIFTRSAEMSPVFCHTSAVIQDSLVSNGAVIEGTVQRSVLSPGVYVASGAMVRDSVILNETLIGPGAQVERAVVDKNVVIGVGARVGSPDADRSGGDPNLAGITVIGKWAQVGNGQDVGPGTVIGAASPIPEEAFDLRKGEVLR